MSKKTNAAIFCAAAAASVVAASSAASSSVPLQTGARRGFSPSSFFVVDDVPRGGSKSSSSSNHPTSSGEKKHNEKKKRKTRKRATTTRSSSETTKKTEDDYSSSSAAGETTTDADSSSANSDRKSPSKSAPPPENKRKNPPKKNPIVEEIIREDDYYKVLGLTRQSAPSDREITKAYRKRCVQTHPDKTNGDRRAFDKVAQAYDVLSNEEKRQIYHRHGKRGVEQHEQTGSATGGFAAGASAEDLFKSFFGAAAGGRGGNPFFQQQQQQRSRNRTVRYQLEVTLEDLYHGKTHKGVKVSPPLSRYQQAFQQSQQSKNVDVHIPRGSLHGEAIVLSGEMDFESSETPADLIFLIKQAPHAVYTRKGHDLALTMTISLHEAICGVQRTIKHLNGKELTIASARYPLAKDNKSAEEQTSSSTLIQSGDVQVLRGYGMPKDEQGSSFGDLYVQYQVEMPTVKSAAQHLTEQELLELHRLLTKLAGTEDKKKTSSFFGFVKKEEDEQKTKVKYLQEASIRDFGRASGIPRRPSAGERHDEEEESPFGQQQFFFSSSGGGFHHPFFGGGGMAGQQDDVQECRQM